LEGAARRPIVELADPRLHLRDDVIKQSKKWTAADVGLKEGDTIDVRYWL
jgi:hypothetical protein